MATDIVYNELTEPEYWRVFWDILDFPQRSTPRKEWSGYFYLIEDAEYLQKRHNDQLELDRTSPSGSGLVSHLRFGPAIIRHYPARQCRSIGKST